MAISILSDNIPIFGKAQRGTVQKTGHISTSVSISRTLFLLRPPPTLFIIGLLPRSLIILHHLQSTALCNKLPPSKPIFSQMASFAPPRWPFPAQIHYLPALVSTISWTSFMIKMMLQIFSEIIGYCPDYRHQEAEAGISGFDLNSLLEMTLLQFHISEHY